MIRVIIVFIFVFFISCTEISQFYNKKKSDGSSRDILTDSLTFKIEEIFQAGFINGLCVAIVDEDSVLFQKGFGFADIETKTSYSPFTLQNIASISKTFLGIALLTGQEKGYLTLDDPIQNYLPFRVINPYFPEDQILIRHLATHTSTIKDTEYYYKKAYILKDDSGSLGDEAELYVHLNPASSKMSMDEYLQRTLSREGDWYSKEGFLNARPGELFEYSNVATALAALVLESATGVSYIEFTKEFILSPLGMHSSGWSFRDIELAYHSKLYLNPETEIPLYSLITYPDGGLITCVDDLGRYLSELIKGYRGKGTLLNNENYREYFTMQLTDSHYIVPKGENQGNFIYFAPDGTIGHSGHDPGTITHMFFNPKYGYGKIVLVNTELDACGQEEYASILKILEDYGKIMTAAYSCDSGH